MRWSGDNLPILSAIELNFVQSFGTILCKGQFAEQAGDKTLLLFKEQCGFKGYFSFFVIKKRNIPLTLKRKNILFHLLNMNNLQASCTGAEPCSGDKIVSFRTCFGI